MAKVINVNAAATNLLVGAELLRVKMEDGMLKVKATGKSRSTNPYEGEEMTVPFVRSKEGQRDRLRILTNLPVEAGSKFDVIEGTYGWLHFVPTDKVFPSVPGGSVSER